MRVTSQIVRSIALVNDARLHELPLSIGALLELVLIASSWHVVMRVVEQVEVIQLVHLRRLVRCCALLATYRFCLPLLRQRA